MKLRLLFLATYIRRWEKKKLCLLKEITRKDIFLVLKSCWMSCPYLNLSRTYQFTLRRKKVSRTVRWFLFESLRQMLEEECKNKTYFTKMWAEYSVHVNMNMHLRKTKWLKAGTDKVNKGGYCHEARLRLCFLILYV